MSKRLLLILCVSTLALGALAFGSRAQSDGSRERAAQLDLEPHTPELPEHVPYMFLFARQAHFLKEAEKLERQGVGMQNEVAAYRTALKQEAELNDEQARSFDEIAAECARKVALKDAQAKVIIDALAAQFPDGKVPEGVELPPPPAELSVLQQERDAIILEARDRLRAAFGDEEFARFNRFVKETVTHKITTHNGEDRRPETSR